MMAEMKKQTAKGFTLIELMIVVAIIGILASIAIPQFSAFRIKAFNSGALSDLHSARLAEESVYGDYQLYGSSVTTGVSGTNIARLSSTSIKPVVATPTAGHEAPLSISKNVTLYAQTTVSYNNVAIVTKHLNGDKSYLDQTDLTGIYFTPAAPGTLVAAHPPTATVPAGYIVM